MKFKLRNIFLTITFSVYCISLYSQPADTERPRLVIGIMMDGLQQKHIDLLWNYFDPNGFKKIIGEGSNCENVHYDIISAGDASDIANVMTGSIPYFNGIAGNNYYDRDSRSVVPIIEDDNQVGIGTKRTVSAHNMLSSTIMDELMLAYPNKSKSYAVAINATDAIMLGGHTANSVAWIDDEQLKWVTTGYYTDGLSHWADDMNVNGVFQNYTARTWGPLYAINTYSSAPNREDKRFGFLYDPRSLKSKNLPETILKTTPSANSLVADLALKIITEEQLGTDKYPDMMMLQFTVHTPFEKTSALQSAEKEDMYLRLDKDIQNLLQKIDVKIGLNKTLVFMFGNQTGVHSPAELGENKIPAGYFNANRSMALLSTYLMAVYGQERWIDGYYAKNIYLNKKKIEEKKINFHEMQQNIAQFMLEFEGIQDAFPSSQVLNMGRNGNSILERIQNSSNKKSIGDIILTLLPGWIEVDDKNNPVGESNAIVSYTPLYFYGWQIPAKKVIRSYQTTDIAPTISRILNIPMPNASLGKPIEEVISK
ncbi:MAG: alkaline phosphatase family protein [Paludibacter sp.]|nr:alkaline phosphatase family protein [Paludibacter sp.]